MNKTMILQEGIRYSDFDERFSMVPNFFFDEGEFFDLDIYERYSLIYIVRKLNQKQKTGKQDIFYMSTEELARVTGISLSRAKKTVKVLQDKGYMKKIQTGSNLTGRANMYMFNYLQPIYELGEPVELSELNNIEDEDERNQILVKCGEVVYYYEHENLYSHKKRLPVFVNYETGEYTCRV